MGETPLFGRTLGVEGSALSHQFGRLYGSVTDRDVAVAEVCGSNEGGRDFQWM